MHKILDELEFLSDPTVDYGVCWVLGHFGHGHFGLGRFGPNISAHTPTHNLWLWPKRPPLTFSVAEMSGPKRLRPKCPWLKCPTFVRCP